MGNLAGFFGKLWACKCPKHLGNIRSSFGKRFWNSKTKYSGQFRSAEVPPLELLSPDVRVNIRKTSARIPSPNLTSVATPAEPRGEKKLFLVQILGGEKLLKIVEKCR